MGYSSPPPRLSSPSPSPPPVPSPPFSSTVPFSWEKQPGVPKSRQQQQQKQQKVEKAAFLPLPPPPAPLGSSGRNTPSSRHAPSGGHTCRKKQHHCSGHQQHVQLARIFAVVDGARGQTKAAANVHVVDDDPFSLALARCAEEARRPNTVPFQLPSPPLRRPSQTLSAGAASTWGSSNKTKSSRSGSATGRLSSAFRPLDLYGSCRSSGVSCGSSVVHSTVTVRRRSTSEVDYYPHGRQPNKQYVAYAILYGRHA